MLFSCLPCFGFALFSRSVQAVEDVYGVGTEVHLLHSVLSFSESVLSVVQSFSTACG